MEIIVRASVVFAAIWLITRGTGKRELAEMTAFELILLVTIGDLVQQGVTQEDMSVTGALLAIGTIAMWVLVCSYLSFRFRATRTLIEGVPVILLRNGEVIDESLRTERMTLDELKEAARNQGITDLGKVDLAILEPDGKVSFLQPDGGEQQHEAPEKHKG